MNFLRQISYRRFHIEQDFKRNPQYTVFLKQHSTSSGWVKSIIDGCKAFNFNQIFSNYFRRVLFSVDTTEIYHSTKKRQHNFEILKAFIVRHSSEYENVG